MDWFWIVTCEPELNSLGMVPFERHRIPEWALVARMCPGLGRPTSERSDRQEASRFSVVVEMGRICSQSFHCTTGNEECVRSCHLCSFHLEFRRGDVFHLACLPSWFVGGGFERKTTSFASSRSSCILQPSSLYLNACSWLGLSHTDLGPPWLGQGASGGRQPLVVI